MKTITAYEIVSLLSETEQREFSICGKDLYRLHNELLKNNIRSNFTRSAFEELSMFYPEQIRVESQEIFISIQHYSDFEYSFIENNTDPTLTQIISKEWKTIKEY